jgi:hypothetical protein
LSRKAKQRRTRLTFGWETARVFFENTSVVNIFYSNIKINK